MSSIALYYVCSVGIYYNMYRLKKNKAPPTTNPGKHKVAIEIFVNSKFNRKYK